jgi:hypothetical protein
MGRLNGHKVRRIRTSANRLFAIVVTVSISLMVAEGLGRVVFRIAAGRWQPLSSPFFNRIPVLRQSDSLGWEYIPHASGIQLKEGRQIEWHINSKGLRESEEYGYERDGKPVKRILVLGDSFTAGDGVNEAARWTERVSHRLGPHVQVINAGVPAYAPDQELLWYRSEGVNYDVDAVVLAYLDENLVRIGVPYFPYEPRYKKTSFTLCDGALKAISSDTWTRVRIELSYRTLIWYSAERLILHPTTGSVAYQSYKQTDHVDLVPLLIAMFDETNRIAEANGARFAVLSFPDPDLDDLEGRFDLDQSIGRQAAEKAIVYHSTFNQYFRDATEDSIRAQTFADGHWNAAGNNRFASLVMPFFENLVAAVSQRRESGRGPESSKDNNPGSPKTTDPSNSAGAHHSVQGHDEAGGA